MLTIIIIAVITCIAMIGCVLFFPTARVGKLKFDTYWIVALLGAVATLLCLPESIGKIGAALTADTLVNPIKILVLFLSMTVLSVFLDELGFFKRLATAALRRAGDKQLRLMLFLYLLVSVLTVFTSNDVIILSFTPFICYFAASAKIDPLPYLAAEFVAANTWSMALIIGNPTNIYLATAAGIDFAGYVKYSALPTLFGGITAFIMLLIVFRKKLSAPIAKSEESFETKDRPLLRIGIIHLVVATILLAIGSYIGMEMWIAALGAVVSLAVTTLIVSAVRRQKPTALIGCAKRLPYQLVPFVLSMFVIIAALDFEGVTGVIKSMLGDDQSILKYGIASFLSANLINNIPMSVLFSSIIGKPDTGAMTQAVFASIIGSNICAFFTPIGALAGIMWRKLIEKHDVKFGYTDFLKIGVTVALPTLFASLGGLMLSFALL